MQKVCRKCNQEKPIDSFYQHKQMMDGHLNICKECTKERVKDYAHTEHGRKVAREWFKTEKGKAKLTRHRIKNRKLFPEKYRARQTAQNALRNGTLKRKPCEICGNTQSEKHHEDYAKPLEIKWLCRYHHQVIENRRKEL